MGSNALAAEIDHCPGYIYGVIHPSFPGYVKIGRALSPKRRLRQYNTADPRRSFEMAFAIHCSDHHTAEKIAHRRLDGFRIADTEWFCIAPEDAFNLIRNRLEPV